LKSEFMSGESKQKKPVACVIFTCFPREKPLILKQLMMRFCKEFL
jgi:hypothetical protein